MNEPTFELKLDEANELRFHVAISGTDSEASKVRFICEGEDISYLFHGRRASDDEVAVTLPPMINVLDEGTYSARLEVIVENKHFTPLELKVNFKRPVSVMAEAAAVNGSRIDEAPVAPSKPQPSVVASVASAPKVVKTSGKPVTSKGMAEIRQALQGLKK